MRLELAAGTGDGRRARDRAGLRRRLGAAPGLAAQAPSAKDARTLAATSLLIEVGDFLGASRTDWSSMLLYWAMLPWLACVARASRPPRGAQPASREIFAAIATVATVETTRPL